MAILAIDVSKSSLSFYSDFIGKGFVDNSPQGIFDLFNKASDSSSDFILVLESTGIYSFDVANYFFQNHIPVFWVKTDNMKLYRKILNRPKTDKIDAKLIFDIASKFPDSLVPFVNNSYIISELRNLTRLYLKLNEDIARLKLRLYSYVSLYFPKLDFKLNKTYESLLKDFTVEEIATMPLEELFEYIAKVSRHIVSSKDLAEKIQSLAKNALRLSPNPSNTLRLSIVSTIELIQHYEKQINLVKKEISKLIKRIPNTLTTVKGIGDITAAGIIAEIGDINRFRNASALASYAGLVWNIKQSGNYKSENTQLTKKGNKYLRTYLVMAANSLRIYDPIFKDYYQRKYTQTTTHKHMRALILSARKLVNLVYYLLKNNVPYVPNR
ncbi:transposase repeat family ISChy1 [Thermosipho africanus TCF52B]|uniref:Transposase repeat family ISChy1 n=2 Tax=Thermosipho TaxID=2420 RepID=C0QMW5_THEAB|nr:IS110 family transposase [Thermosipho africanus]ACN29532.1 transposase repeat family ISChy1 [Thermosipho africanus TCF52B]